MSAVTDELKSFKDELEAVSIGLVGTLDLAMEFGVHPNLLGEIQDAIDNTNSVCMDLGGVIRGIELSSDPQE